MEKERRKLSERDINEVVKQLGRTGRYSKDVLELVREDLKFGLIKTEIDLYLNSKFSISQCKKISKALRLYGIEVACVIAKPEIDEHRMQVSMEFYEKGVPLAVIEENVAKQMSAHALKKLYKTLLEGMKEAEKAAASQTGEMEREKAEEVLAEMKRIALAIQHNDEKYEVLGQKLKELENNHRYEEEIDILHKRLEDKDKLLNNQQDMIQQANAALVRLRKEAAKKEKEMSALQETVEKLKSELKEKSFDPKEEFYGVPMQYAVRFSQDIGRSPVIATVETKQRKNVGALAVFSKVTFKKKSRQDIVKLVASGDLNTGQLVQIRAAIERGLTEGQLLNLIHSGASAEQMKEIIEIAALENNLK